MRYSSVWPEGEPEFDAERIYKFVLADTKRALQLCAETDEIMTNWMDGVAAIVSLQMPTFSIEEVGSWLGTNCLTNLVATFRDSHIDGRRLAEMHSMDAVPTELQMTSVETDLETLASRVARIQGFDRRSPRLLDSVDTAVKSSSGYDCVLVHKAEDAQTVEAMLQLFPAQGDGLGEWKIFKSGLDSAASDDEFDKHSNVLQGTPNVLVLCTQGFFKREIDLDTGREEPNRRLELVAKALEVPHLNILCVYSPDFRIPKPNRLPASVRPILKLDFHKLDLEIQDVGVACAKRICGDFVSERHGDGQAFASKWKNTQQAVFACIESDDVTRQAECFDDLLYHSATLDGEHQFYASRAVEAAAEALGCAVVKQGGRTSLSQPTPVVNKPLIKLILLNFLMATFNLHDQKTRAAVIGFDGGIHALIGSLLKMQDEKKPDGSGPDDEEEDLMMLALKLVTRLGRNEANMHKMRLIGTVKMARRCLTYQSRPLRYLAEQTISEILNLDSTM